MSRSKTAVSLTPALSRPTGEGALSDVTTVCVSISLSDVRMVLECGGPPPLMSEERQRAGALRDASRFLLRAVQP